MSATPSDFATAVQEYYTRKADYDRQIKDFFSGVVDQAEEEVDKPTEDTTRTELLAKLRQLHIESEGKKSKTKQATMPSGREDHAPGDITDQVAKDSKDSGASDHSLHNVDTGAKSGDHARPRASAGDYQAMPGPVMTDKLPEPASKEELKKRSEELNK